MAFDQQQRNRLARFVTEARSLLTEEFTRQLQADYAMDPASGAVNDVGLLRHLDNAQRETARQLRATLDHYLAGEPKADAKSLNKVRTSTLDRIVREQAFTVLNRLCALRLAEARGLLLESIARGYQSKGFLLYQKLAGSALGETGDAYRCYLFSIFDEFAVDLPVLFDRFSPQGRLFPREAALVGLLELINHPDLEPLWAQDETIGWIYQYFNSKEERQRMRAESQAPRNSRELAVRNQFFTPRYVVEFLTDNTLGRIWYEMTRGDTRLVEQCRYLVRRPLEIFLDDPDLPAWEGCRPWVGKVRRGDFSELPDEPMELELAAISLAFDGYTVAERIGGYGDLLEWANAYTQAFEHGGALPATALDLWLILFALQRSWRWNTQSAPIGDDFLDLWRRIYLVWRAAIQAGGDNLTQEELLRQPIYIPHRAPKDPREILMLDPACGSMHFGLYAFDLYQTIYAEAWERGWVPAEDFGWRAQPEFVHASVRLNPERAVVSNYSGAVIPVDQAYLVISHRGDGGDGVIPHQPYIVSAETRFRVPIDIRMPLRDFDYQTALADNVFDATAGEALVRAVGCFDFEELPAVSREEAHARFLGEVPRLVVEHNIHGIDIDPRAVQIAGLSLWLRAQRAWHEKGVARADRPTITRSNVVCAEPMPGEESLLDEFLASLRNSRLEHLIRSVLEVPEQQRVRATPAMADALCALVRTVWDEMKLAGEAGSLLKIEESLAAAVAKGRAEWDQKLPLLRIMEYGFGDAPLKPKRSYARMVPGDEEDFWARAETLVLAALEEYAALAEGPHAAQRRLFAGDARQGFAFIDVCRRQYDVVLMNPPFGAKTAAASQVIDALYSAGRHDLATAFVIQAYERLVVGGLIGVIMTRTPFFLSRFKPWRCASIFNGYRSIAAFVDLGQGVLDSAMVEATLAIFGGRCPVPIAYDFQASGGNEILPTQFDIGLAIPFTLPLLELVPNRPLAYWVPASLFQKFSVYGLYSRVAEVKQGLATRDNDRFVRLWYEVPLDADSRSEQWRPYAKGGEYAKFYLPLHLVVNWSESALADYLTRTGQMVVLLTKKREQYLNRPGVTYSKRSQLGFSARTLPQGAIFSPNGPGVFPFDKDDLYYHLAFLNSSFARACLEFLTSFGSYSEGYVESLPFSNSQADVAAELSSLSKKQVDVSRHLYSHEEVYREFSGLGLNNNKSLSDALSALRRFLDDQVSVLGDTYRDLDHAVSESLQLTAEEVDFAARNSYSILPTTTDTDIEEDHDVSTPFVPNASEYLSHAIGCLFGRWDIRLTTGERQPPPLPGPFDPLPVCPPGMLQNAQGLPATPADVPADYPLRISWGGILPDDAGHPDDVEARLRDVLQVIWGPQRAGDIEEEACRILGVPSLRDYMRKPAAFFDDHLKRYSKSRRVAPIYWPLSTPSGAYTLWLYYHRLTDQTLYSCVNDFVDPKLKQVARELERMRAIQRRSHVEERELEQFTNLDQELRAFRAELLRVAGFWKPDLNDGVQITAAPLWRLFQHRAWQRRLKETWEKLEAGDYDWAHLAYSIWPERVRAKCVHDKSLAIAHGLEELYVEPPSSTKKKPKKVNVEETEVEMVEE